MSGLDGTADAGVAAIAAVLDAGGAVAGTMAAQVTPGASPGVAFDWLHAGAGPGALVTAIVVIFGWWFTRLSAVRSWMQRKLESTGS